MSIPEVGDTVFIPRARGGGDLGIVTGVTPLGEGHTVNVDWGNDPQREILPFRLSYLSPRELIWSSRWHLWIAIEATDG